MEFRDVLAAPPHSRFLVSGTFRIAAVIVLLRIVGNSETEIRMPANFRVARQLSKIDVRISLPTS